MSKQCESELVSGLRAFTVLCDEIEPRVARIAIRTIKSGDERAAFLEDWRATVLLKAHLFDPARWRFAKWALGVVLDECNQIKRRLEAELPLSEIECVADHIDSIADADTRIDYEMAVSKLPPTQKECWLLKQDGYSYAEIARVNGISIGAVCKNIAVARRKIGDSMIQ